MFNMNEFKKGMKSDVNSPAFKLLERVVDEMDKRGVAPYYVLNFHNPAAYDEHISFEELTKYTTADTIYRNNGTKENVSVKISIEEKTGKTSARRIFSIKVPKDASDKVIEKRIDAVIEALNA